MQEEREKAGEGRLERNRRWRQRKQAPPSSSPSVCSSSKELEDIQEEKLSRRREPSERRQDEKEARREKNKEWRKKRTGGEEDSAEKILEIQGPRLGELLRGVLECSCGKVSSFRRTSILVFLKHNILYAQGLGTAKCSKGHFICEECTTEVQPFLKYRYCLQIGQLT